MTDSRKCWKCGTALTIEVIRWGRDATASPWFVHSTTKTPLCHDEASVPICK